MLALLPGILAAFWLGLLTAISPCPLTANIAAMSFLGRRADRPGRVLLAGALYVLGRTVTYVALAVLLVYSLLSAPLVSHLLQKYMNKLLGPVLVLVGMVLLDLLQVGPRGGGLNARTQQRVEASGLVGAALLGVLLALSFCPVSAALFFGSLISLSVKAGSWFWLPFVYGIGTGLPVLGFAFLLALGARWVGQAFARLTQVERWLRRVTGAVLVLAGIYFILVYIFGILR